jgi:putative N-acetyltransferase (TIGR04045 family)
LRRLRGLFGVAAGGRLIMLDIVQSLGGPPAREESAAEPWLIVDAGELRDRLDGYRTLRHREFVQLQGLFADDDSDDFDLYPATRVLVALAADGEVVGGVRIHAAAPDSDAIGWWQGSRLVVDAAAGRLRGRIGAALVRAACARALDAGALRFDAHVQEGQVAFFERLGWDPVRVIEVAGRPHRLMRWNVGRIAELVRATKAPLGTLLGPMLPHDRWRGDDGVPVPGSDVVACVDAITPSMVERDPEWAGWCGMLVTAHDLAAMGAEPVGALDALGAADRGHAHRVLTGIRRGAEALGLPVLGGHTQLGVPAALSVTGLGRTGAPVAAGAGRAGDVLTLTADLEGDWRPGYAGRQWDSTSWRTRDELAPMLSAVRRARPHAAKDVSMAGLVGTVAMLAEASGIGAEVDVAAVPRPAPATLSDWLTCFPGMAFVTADAPGAPLPEAGACVSARCGRLQSTAGVRLRWPDGDVTEAVPGGTSSGLGAARA